MIRKIIFLLSFIGLIFQRNTSFGAERLNFMLINLTELDITDVYISPSMYPAYATENLLNTNINSGTIVCIGPNYYGN
jgi:hypothetical protein